MRLVHSPAARTGCRARSRTAPPSGKPASKSLCRYVLPQRAFRPVSRPSILQAGFERPTALCEQRLERLASSPSNATTPMQPATATPEPPQTNGVARTGHPAQNASRQAQGDQGQRHLAADARRSLPRRARPRPGRSGRWAAAEDRAGQVASTISQVADHGRRRARPRRGSVGTAGNQVVRSETRTTPARCRRGPARLRRTGSRPTTTKTRHMEAATGTRAAGVASSVH